MHFYGWIICKYQNEQTQTNEPEWNEMKIDPETENIKNRTHTLEQRIIIAEILSLCILYLREWLKFQMVFIYALKLEREKSRAIDERREIEWNGMEWY